MAALVVITHFESAGLEIGTGNPKLECKGYVGDPALQGDGTGHDMQGFNITVTVPAATPATWASDIRTALIAAAVGTGGGFTVASNRVFIPTIA